jgi:uncharacterized protein (DUF2141 family)
VGHRYLLWGERLRLAKENQRGTFAVMLSVLKTIVGSSLAIVFFLALGQAVGDEAKPEVKLGTLIIEFDGLANNKGEVLAGLYNDAKKFPKENQALHNLKGKPSKKKCVIKALKLRYGEYGVAAMHDENGSGNMDYNLIGLPKEIYGFSNNKRPLFGPPGFKACRFVIDKPVVKIRITLK